MPTSGKLPGSLRGADIWVTGARAGCWTELFTHFTSVLTAPDVDSLLPIWQMRTLRLGEVQQLAQDNTTSKYQSED